MCIVGVQYWCAVLQCSVGVQHWSALIARVFLEHARVGVIELSFRHYILYNSFLLVIELSKHFIHN